MPESAPAVQASGWRRLRRQKPAGITDRAKTRREVLYRQGTRNPLLSSDLYHQRQYLFREQVGTLDRRQMTDIRQHRQLGIRYRLLNLFRHRNRRGVIFFADDHAD